jgi:gas vesicle protein
MSKKLLAGFIAGAVAGTLIGILLAPDKGSNTRQKMAGKVNDGLKKLKRTLGSLGEDQHLSEESYEWEHAERPYTASMSKAW